MVIALHFNGRSTGAVITSVSVWRFKIFVWGIEALSYPAVNCYILISGYYSFKNDNNLFECIRNLVKLWLVILSYSIFGYLITMILTGSPINAVEMLKRFFPLTRGNWWFMSNYFPLIFLSPLLNKLVRQLEKNQIKLLLLFSIVTCSILPFFTRWAESLGINNGYSLIWFIVLYITGAYLQRFYTKYNFKPAKFFTLYLGCAALLIATSFIFGRVAITRGMHLLVYSSIIVYLQSIFLFITFISVGLPRFFNKGIWVSLSKLSIASYLFHCQEDIEKLIWTRLKPWEYANTYVIVTLFFGTILVLYLISITFESVRVKLGKIKNIENCLVNTLSSTIIRILKNYKLV